MPKYMPMKNQKTIDRIDQLTVTLTTSATGLASPPRIADVLAILQSVRRELTDLAEPTPIEDRLDQLEQSIHQLRSLVTDTVPVSKQVWVLTMHTCRQCNTMATQVYDHQPTRGDIKDLELKIGALNCIAYRVTALEVGGEPVVSDFPEGGTLS